MAPHFKDLTGGRFGRLLVVGRRKSEGGRRRWLCRCDCGKEHVVSTLHLNSGETKSCGCYFADVVAERRRLSIEYRRTPRTPTFWSWRGLVARCGYESIERSWLGPEGFERFLEDVGPRPEGTALGRFADTGDYVRSNVAWMTKEQQQEQRAVKRARLKEQANNA